MASWGSWSNGQSGAKSRLGFDRSVSSTSSQTTVTLTVYLEFSGYSAYGNGTLTLSGGHSVSQSVNLSFSGSGTRTLGTFKQTFTRPYGSASSRTTSISISGWAGGSPTAASFYTIPRRLYDRPAAPSVASAGRVSNSQADIAWVVPSSTAAPVASVEVIRRSNQSDWNYTASTFTSRSGTARLAGLSQGNRYQWAIRGVNRDETGPWAYTDWLYQRPLPVSNVTATRSGSNIVVSWVNRNNYPYGGFRIFHNGAEIATVGASVTSWTHAAPDPAVSHTYRVQAYYLDLNTDLVTSNTVQLLSPPLAPTNLTPDGGYVVAGTTVGLYWDHNSVDGSSQARREVRVRKAGTSTWTTLTGTTSQSASINVASYAANGESIEWQVRTQGDHANFGPWSSIAEFGVVARPIVAITAPASGATIAAASTDLTFTISRVPASYRVELLQAGAVVQTVEDYTTVSPVSVRLRGLRDAQSYSARVTATERVTSNPVTRSFTVSYPQPGPPALTGEWDLSSAAVHLTVQSPSGTPAASQLRVETWVDGEWTELETVPAPGTVTITDPYARLDGARYRAIAIAAIGADLVESAPSEDVGLGVFPVPAHFLNFGEQAVRIRYNPALTRTASASDLVLVDLDDDTPDPVAIFGPKERHTAALSGLLLDDPGQSARDQAMAFQALAVWKDLVLLRTIDAPPVWGVVSGLSQPRELWGGYQVSLTHTKAR